MKGVRDLKQKSSRKGFSLILAALLLFSMGTLTACTKKPSSETTSTAVESAFDAVNSFNPADIQFESEQVDESEVPEGTIAIGILKEDADLFETLPAKGAASTALLSLKTGDQIYIFGVEGEYVKGQPVNSDKIGYIKKAIIDTGGIPLDKMASAAQSSSSNASSKGSSSGSSSNTSSKGSSSGSSSSAVSSKDTTNPNSPENFPVNGSPYLVYVEKGSHTITIYGKDEDGKYTRALRTYLTATGRSPGMTPVGVFKIGGKEKWHKWGSSSFSPYASYYYGGLFIHGPLYRSKSFGALIESSVSAIGTNASSGCMRTSAQAAYFIYAYCPSGTYIKIVNGSPLGRGAGRPAVSTQYVDPATGRVPATGVDISPDSTTLTVGDTKTLKAVFSPPSASEKACNWSSSDRKVATVSTKGLVTAVAKGTCTITVKTVDGGFTATCKITVNPKEVKVTGVTISAKDVTLIVGGTKKLSCTVSPSDATNKAVTWSSSNTGVATVSSDGTVTAKKKGTATITVTTKDGGFTAKMTITVKDAATSIPPSSKPPSSSTPSSSKPPISSEESSSPPPVSSEETSHE